MTTTAIRYRKTRENEWVVYGPAATLRAALQNGTGQVSVSKKDGTAKVEEIFSMGRPFEVDGQQMAYGYMAAQAGSTNGSTCEECGSRPAVKTATDSSGIVGKVCGRCARLPRHERSFA